MQALQPGSTLQGGRYRILSTLGQGGYGITYKAQQQGLGRLVAIKEFFISIMCDRDASKSTMITASTSNTKEVERYRRKFISEAQMISRLHHPNIVSILDVFEENGSAYYVMEYVEGGSLGDRMREGAMSEAEALKYIRPVADALNYIHKQKICHYDIKPSNIMVWKDIDQPVLIDFGVSKHYDEEDNATTTTPVGLSEGYAPLEQYNAQEMTSFSPQTDIYSLGATLLALVTGKKPPTPTNILTDGLTLPAHLSTGLQTAIRQAMVLNRDKRTASVEQFLTMLGNIVQTPIVEATMVLQSDDESDILSSKYEDGTKAAIYSETFEVNGVRFKMIRVDGGTFQMGADIIQDSEADNDESPVHSVSLSTYMIGETEVTQALWMAVMGSNPSYFTGDLSRPVESVSWAKCCDFLMKLNSLTGKTFRLPTEAEWEFAARGGNQSHGYKYSGSNNIDEVAWYDRNSYVKGFLSRNYLTHPVAMKSPNELGLYDMSGNVWEWCSDWYGPYGSSSQTNPEGASSGSFRVFRGGSLFNCARFCRSSFRSYNTPGTRDYYLGLRLAL